MHKNVSAKNKSDSIACLIFSYSFLHNIDVFNVVGISKYKLSRVHKYMSPSLI